MFQTSAVLQFVKKIFFLENPTTGDIYFSIYCESFEYYKDSDQTFGLLKPK